LFLAVQKRILETDHGSLALKESQISCTQRKPPASLCNVLPSDTHWASYLPVDTTYI